MKLVGLLFAILYLSTAFSQEKPNLLLILTDQQRFDALGRMQAELEVPEKSRIRTPNLDRLTREGAYFRAAYTPCAVCGPARTSILTGHTIENTGVRSNGLAYDDNIKKTDDAHWKIPAIRTYDEILVEDHGYIAEFYGKWHSPEQKGFVYNNDVRIAGIPETWFGKYEADGTTKHMSLGMNSDFLQWLDNNNIPIPPLQDGQQTNTFNVRPYIPDPLDSRYGKPPGNMENTGQPNLHGMNLVPDGYSVTAHQAQETIEAMERLHNSGKPFSLTVSFHLPHAPMVPTPKYYNMYDPADMPVPASIKDDMSNSPYANANGKGSLGPGYQNPEMVQRWTANYYGLVSEIDEWVGKLMEKLIELGIEDNTLVAFSSDHGEMLGSHGLREKNIFYEESAHIPLFLRMPGKILAGTVVKEPVSLIDLHSTFRDYLGITGNYKSDGSSLRRYIEGTHTGDGFVVTEWKPGSSPAFMIRKGDWKLMVPHTAASNVLDMLYHLETDPYEMNNLVGKNGQTADEPTIGKAEHLKALLADYLTEMKHPAADEIKNRRKWLALDFWVSDTVLNFREVLSGGSASEWLYLGSAAGGQVSITDITIEGADAERYSLDWTQGVIPGNGNRVLTVTYTDLGTSDPSSSANLIIKHDAGNGDRTVRLLSPAVAALGKVLKAPEHSIEVQYRLGKLSVTGPDNSAWSLRIKSVIGGNVQELSGRGTEPIPLKLRRGMYVVQIKTRDINLYKPLAVIK